LLSVSSFATLDPEREIVMAEEVEKLAEKPVVELRSEEIGEIRSDEQLLQQSVLSIEQIVRDDLLKTIAVKLDYSSLKM
jgi:hypothetical protein